MANWAMIRNVAVRFTETESGPRLLDNMISISVLELLVTLFGCVMCGKKVLEERESRNSLVGT